MKNTVSPIRTTILWGLLSGIFYLPLCIFLNSLLPRPLGFQLLLWALLAGYAVLLSHWTSRSLKMVAVPIGLLLAAVFFIQATPMFLAAALGILGWMRSGIFFNHTPVFNRWIAEIGLGMGAVLPLSVSGPAVTISAALGIWMFFLVQALYFVVFDDQGQSRSNVGIDPFERARMAAERILSSEVI